MPIYEYRCKKCGSEFELLIRSDDKPKCPDCSSAKLERKFSVVAAHTQGSTPSCQVGDMGGCPAPTGGCGGGCQFRDM